MNFCLFSTHGKTETRLQLKWPLWFIAPVVIFLYITIGYFVSLSWIPVLCFEGLSWPWVGHLKFWALGHWDTNMWYLRKPVLFHSSQLRASLCYTVVYRNTVLWKSSTLFPYLQDSNPKFYYNFCLPVLDLS